MVNKVILVGNLGFDPEIRTLESGIKVARLRIATTERYTARDTQERKEHTEWHTVTLWRGLAGVAEQYLRKGSRVYIEGRLRSNEWTDEHQQRRVSIEVLGDSMHMLDRRQDMPQEGYGHTSAVNSAPGQGGYAPSAGGAQPSAGGYQPQQQPSYSYPRQAAPAPAPAAAATPDRESISKDDNDDLPF